MQAIINELPGILMNCGDLPGGVDKISKLIDMLANPASSITTIGKNIFLKGPSFLSQLIDANNSFNAKEFYWYGYKLGRALSWFFDL
jgi:hypothetical protein